MNDHTPAPRCRDTREHAAEAFLLDGACVMGTWDVAGLKWERDSSGAEFGWKNMRCGCVFVALLRRVAS